MARSRGKANSVEQQLAALRSLDPAAPDALAKLTDALRAPSGIVVAAAARIVAGHALHTVVGELPDAFERLTAEPRAMQDPGCRGKIAIARALHELDHWEDRVFVVGLTIRQPEGYNPEGPPDDTAAELRGVCGLAHAHFGRSDALDVLAVLLADAERVARIAAAQAIGDAGRADASALLRYKILVDDREDAEVLAACFESLLHLGRDAAVPFVIAQLVHHDDRAETAALALAGRRVTEALDALVAWCSRCPPEQRYRVGYLALALLRSDVANAVLVEAIATRARNDAIAAARALATFKDDPSVAERLRAAAAAHLDPAVGREVRALLA